MATQDRLADGPDQVRAAVRYQVKYGADVIKTCATGGVLSEGDAVGVPQYDFDELKAMVDEATKLERKVAAHAHGTEGIKIAVRAGVASIEHGSFLDDEGAKLMAQHGTYLVPTLMAGEAVERAAKDGSQGTARRKGARGRGGDAQRDQVAMANNVPIALGTDAGVSPTARTGRVSLMVEWGGMTPMQAIVAGTMQRREAARLGRPHRHARREQVRRHRRRAGRSRRHHRRGARDFVMKDGVVYKQPATPTTAALP